VAVAAAAWPGRPASAQAPARADLANAPSDRQRLAGALRELNDAAGLGVTEEDLARAEAYATGALLETAAKLRTLPLPEDLDLPVVFRARRAR
jgi:hypothetical protein